MAVKLRFKRIGRRHRSVFRLSAMDAHCPRDGRVLEELGTYDPTNKDTQAQITLKEDRIKYWLSVGAVPTETVASILKKNGITTR
ncbi:MAG: 30S ribosomal protein S16 [Phycisphaerae bacterium]|nr:30S ribosomal protein S16 [Phycisphaerae bacterium]